jgi:hypothetical protein
MRPLVSVIKLSFFVTDGGQNKLERWPLTILFPSTKIGSEVVPFQKQSSFIICKPKKPEEETCRVRTL